MVKSFCQVIRSRCLSFRLFLGLTVRFQTTGMEPAAALTGTCLAFSQQAWKLAREINDGAPSVLCLASINNNAMIDSGPYVNERAGFE